MSPRVRFHWKATPLPCTWRCAYAAATYTWLRSICRTTMWCTSVIDAEPEAPARATLAGASGSENLDEEVPHEQDGCVPWPGAGAGRGPDVGDASERDE